MGGVSHRSFVFANLPKCKINFLYLYEWKSFYHLDQGSLKVGLAKKMNKPHVQ